MLVTFHLTTDCKYLFFNFIEKGFLLEVQQGISLFHCLTQVLALDSQYVEQRIQTIFLNHKPIDDIQTTCLCQGDVIALSAAMPGLMGATLRRGGVYSVMRDSISYKPTQISEQAQKVWIKIKIFNLIAKEIGAGLLQNGIWVESKQLAEFLSDQYIAIQDRIARVEVDSKEQSIDQVYSALKKNQHTHLTVLTV